VVCMDPNEDIYLLKKIGKALTKSEGTALQEVVDAFTEEKLGSAFFLQE